MAAFGMLFTHQPHLKMGPNPFWEQSSTVKLQNDWSRQWRNGGIYAIQAKQQASAGHRGRSSHFAGTGFVGDGAGRDVREIQYLL